LVSYSLEVSEFGGTRIRAVRALGNPKPGLVKPMIITVCRAMPKGHRSDQSGEISDDTGFAQRGHSSPSPGQRPGKTVVIMPASGPTGQPFGDRLARWAEGTFGMPNLPQGVALGWENSGPSARAWQGSLCQRPGGCNTTTLGGMLYAHLAIIEIARSFRDCCRKGRKLASTPATPQSSRRIADEVEQHFARRIVGGANQGVGCLMGPVLDNRRGRPALRLAD
jgi:hypothetical protein